MMSTAHNPDSGICRERSWCDEVAGHSGPHVQYVGSFSVLDHTGGPVALSVVSTGTTAGDRHVELLVNGRDCGLQIMLTRPQQAKLSKLLA